MGFDCISSWSIHFILLSLGILNYSVGMIIVLTEMNTRFPHLNDYNVNQSVKLNDLAPHFKNTENGRPS